MSFKILILEDDPLFNETIQDFLEEEGFRFETALDPYTALELTYNEKFDLYLFDVNLPYESGFDLLEKLRESGDRTPTIFVTSRSQKDSLLMGFDVGADDYMKKPIDLDELLARIEALLRRELKSQKLYLGDYLLDYSVKQLYYKEEFLKIGSKAVQLLWMLVRAKGEIVTIEEIERELWSSSQESSLGAVRVYITALKKHFSNIENIRGIGYRLKDIF